MNGALEWNYDTPPSWGADQLTLPAVGGGQAEIVAWYNGPTANESTRVLIHIVAGRPQSVLLSNVIGYFNTRPYDILWLLCRN